MAAAAPYHSKLEEDDEHTRVLPPRLTLERLESHTVYLRTDPVIFRDGVIGITKEEMVASDDGFLLVWKLGGI